MAGSQAREVKTFYKDWQKGKRTKFKSIEREEKFVPTQKRIEIWNRKDLGKESGRVGLFKGTNLRSESIKGVKCAKLEESGEGETVLLLEDFGGPKAIVR